MHVADALELVRFDAVRLREQVTALVNREVAQAVALRDLTKAIEELLELAPKDSHARKLADRVLGEPLARARRLTGG